MAHWSTEEFNLICQRLKESLTDENTFAFMMYAANSQGDSHIMTLLRAYGCPLYDENGNFAVNTPEGFRPLPGSRRWTNRGSPPKGRRTWNCWTASTCSTTSSWPCARGNLTNLWDARNKGVDVFTANFPDPSGAGFCTASSNGFCVFDNRG